jgi:hypothetical protein
MLALADHAKPGPFAARANLLGRYVGYRHRGRSLAMGGAVPAFRLITAVNQAVFAFALAVISVIREPPAVTRPHSWSL